ncbi:MAG TPA: ribosome small subunit-dependent GTPase A [Bacteroidales bacterium]|nr:ribosome small subunit-dependent GTPase A [Bacteroidales bacterium]
MIKGIVVKTTGSWHTVRAGNTIINCRLKGNFRIREIRNTNPVAVGDQVDVEEEPDNTGTIVNIHPRKNYIIRRATNLSHESHILAVNIDRVFLMITLDFPETPLEFVDRFLISAEAYHIKCILLINKTDLYDHQKLLWLDEVRKIYEFAGYQVFAMSVLQDASTSMLADLLKGRINLIAGNSGVGKSSLINRLYPEIKLKTGTISSRHLTGKHTTTYPEMIELPSGGFLIDTPGIKSFGVIDIDKNETGLYFTDIFKLSKNCRFYNCTHIHEPGCAVVEAFNTGILHPSRYRSYLKIVGDNATKYRNI